MWCGDCQQDVPGIAGRDAAHTVQCARCGSIVSSRGAKPATTVSPMLDLEDWDLEDELKQADRLLAKVRRGTGGAQYRLDEPEPTPTRPAMLQKPSQPPEKKSSGTSGFIVWPVILMGVMAFVCGAVLTGWSHFDNRADLWHLGLPVTLIGQAILIAGLILQLESVWFSARKTSQSVDQIDDQLEDLRRQATLLQSSSTDASQAFYAHMASGAPPGMLLADVKSQLDLVAQQLAKEQQR